MIGSVLFLPIGVIGMIGAVKVLDPLEEEDFENRKEGVWASIQSGLY